MSGIAGTGCERIIPTEEKETFRRNRKEHYKK